MLRPEVLPVATFAVRPMLFALACGLFGAGVTLVSRPRAVAPQTELPEIATPISTPVVVPVEEPPAPVHSGSDSTELGMVFRAGGHLYLRLEEVSDALPKHGALKMFNGGEHDNYIFSSIGVVRAVDLPSEQLKWVDSKVVVDGTCTAKVTGFAVVGRVLGDTGYAGLEDHKWSAKTVMEQGSPVLAARLVGCDEGVFARAASEPAIIVPEMTTSTLETAARERLLASPVAVAAQAKWSEVQRTGTWQADENTTVSSFAVKHPTTGATWIVVQAKYDEGDCGGPDINIWGLYRVDGDTLVTATEAVSGEVWSIDQAIDIDNDGELEFIGTSWMGNERIIFDATGEEITRNGVTFYGCPC